MIFVIRRSHGWGIHEHFCRRHRREIGSAGRGQGRGAAPRGPSRRADRRTETGSVVDGIYAHGASRDDIDDGKGDWAVRVLQVTSSPIKNVKKDAFVDKRWWTPGETVAANAGESTLRMDEYGTKSLSDGTTIAMRANVQALSGKLGRETFVFENHFCVVDLPVGETAPVAVSFVGTTVPHLEPFKGGLVGRFSTCRGKGTAE